MDLLGALAVLVRVVETGSFSAVARERELSQARSHARFRNWKTISGSACFTARRESSA
jgi:hypothetical protein